MDNTYKSASQIAVSIQLYVFIYFIEQEKQTQFNLNLITLDSEHLGIPETNYSSEITMNSFDFQKLCKELHQLSETVTIEASIEYV